MTSTFGSLPAKRGMLFVRAWRHLRQRMIGRIAIMLLTIAVAACGIGGKPYDETAGWSANKLYAEAKDQLASGNYDQAIKYFERLEARYPYGRFAQQAQIEIAYAYYKAQESASSIAASDRFIKLYPNHPNVDYAYFLKGLANFNENRGLFGGLSGQDPAERDPKAARDAFDAFKELAQRFPDSKYTPDAIARMKFLVNALAQHEVAVARWYMRRGAFVAATNRAQFAVKSYPETPATEEALAIMIGAYDALGLDELRDDSRRVLDQNFPTSSFTRRGGKQGAGWARLWQ